MENYFLLSVGVWNLLGSFVLYLMLNQTIADKIMRQWTGTFAHTYDIGKHGALWLWWAATANMFLGAVNLFAAGWESTSQTIVLYGDLFVYGMFLPPIITTLRHPDHGKGNYFHLLLICFWMLWAIYSLI